jgi:PIN domain nuclease of toxin-antitoxin system
VKVLVDTHCWIWLQGFPERFGRGVLEALSDDGVELLLSAASVWEMITKHSLGKLDLPSAPDEWIATRMRDSLTTELPVAVRHALRLAFLPLHHRDPFDRMLVAQAQEEDAVLLTADRQLAAYPVSLWWADEEVGSELNEPATRYDPWKVKDSRP